MHLDFFVSQMRKVHEYSSVIGHISLRLVYMQSFEVICNFRWHNHLDPAIKKDAWTEEEEAILSYYHQIYGNKWAEIARFLPGRYLLTPSLGISNFDFCDRSTFYIRAM